VGIVVLVVIQDTVVFQEYQDIQEHREFQVIVVRLEQVAIQVLVVILVHRDIVAKADLVARQEHLDIVELLATAVHLV